MDDEEREQPQPRHDHRRRCQRLAARTTRHFLDHVARRPRLLVGQKHADGPVNVNHEEQQQSDLDDRQQRIRLEGVRVLVVEGGTEEHHQVAGNMDDEVQEESEAGDPDDEFRPDAGGEEAG